MADADADAVQRFRSFYDTFSQDWLGRLGEIYAPDFDFADPFHAVRGDLDRLRGYFARILELPQTRFTTLDAATGSDGSYVRWRWDYTLRAGWASHSLEGMTHLRFRDGRVAYHRDVFDAAGGVYEHLPVVGRLVRTVRRRIGG